MKYLRREQRKKSGFTLLEMLVSSAVFVTIMLMAVGALLIVNDAYRKTRQLRTTMENLNIAFESVTKKIRAGEKYHCVCVKNADSFCDHREVVTPKDCEYPAGASSLSFEDVENKHRIVRWNSGARIIQIDRQAVCCSPSRTAWRAVTAPEISVDSLKFYVVGAESDTSPDSPDPNEQPRVTITASGVVDIPKFDTEFFLQTTITQGAVVF